MIKEMLKFPFCFENGLYVLVLLRYEFSTAFQTYRIISLKSLGVLSQTSTAASTPHESISFV